MLAQDRDRARSTTEDPNRRVSAEPTRQRKILHIDMDAFYASVEQRDNPELRGKPIAVGGSRERGVVAAASYEAREFGVRSAMPSAAAKRKCPDLIFVKPRFDVYKAVSLQIRAIFAGETGYEGMVKTLDLHPVSAEEGFVVFEGSPTRAVYNPMGSVHGGYTATLLDTVIGCAVHTCVKPGQGYTTLELKIAYHRALTEASGPVRAEGVVVSIGKRAAFAEGKLLDKDGRLCATATTTCLLFSPNGA